jgi:hypothetical protein
VSCGDSQRDFDIAEVPRRTRSRQGWFNTIPLVLSHFGIGVSVSLPGVVCTFIVEMRVPEPNTIPELEDPYGLSEDSMEDDIEISLAGKSSGSGGSGSKNQGRFTKKRIIAT